MTAQARIERGGEGIPLLLTEAEAAAQLRVCTRTLRNERNAGKLTFHMIRGAIRYSPADLQAYIEKARQCPSISVKAPRSGNTRSPSTVFDFEVVRAAKASEKRN